MNHRSRARQLVRGPSRSRGRLMMPCDRCDRYPAYRRYARACSVPPQRMSARPCSMIQPSRVQSSSYRSARIATAGFSAMLRRRFSAVPVWRFGFSSIVT